MVDSAAQARQLFGGALVISPPANFRDMSDRVPIPDNQEVFQDLAEGSEGFNFG